MKRLELIGLRFGRLTVIEQTGSDRLGQSLWRCNCGCGNQKTIRGTDLKKGHTKSCGCGQFGNHIIHGDTPQGNHSRLYTIWTGMKQRCNNAKSKGYRFYGSRGRSICSEWMVSYSAFKNWALKAGYAENLTIDRIDNEKGYSPENCQWITQSENSKKRQGNGNQILLRG